MNHDRLTEKERWEQYQICQDRGHVPSNVWTTGEPPYAICEKCGTKYRYPDPQIVEMDAPRKP